MRNPKWHNGELILALDLYFKIEPGQIHARNLAVIELSQILNTLPFSEAKTDAERYRSPNGGGRRLSDFLGYGKPENGIRLRNKFERLNEE